MHSQEISVCSIYTIGFVCVVRDTTRSASAVLMQANQLTDHLTILTGCEGGPDGLQSGSALHLVSRYFAYSQTDGKLNLAF